MIISCLRLNFSKKVVDRYNKIMNYISTKIRVLISEIQKKWRGRSKKNNTIVSIKITEWIIVQTRKNRDR